VRTKKRVKKDAPDLVYWQKAWVQPTDHPFCTSLDRRFAEDAITCDPGYYNYGLQGMSDAHDKDFCLVVGIAYTMYQCATRTYKHEDNNYILVGRLAQLNDEWVSTTDGQKLKRWRPQTFNAESIYDSNLKMLDELCSYPTILHVANVYWSLLCNDAWVLGGINSHANFRFASPIRMNDLWDSKNKRMTVMARELIALTSFGYQLEPSNDPGGDTFNVKGRQRENIKEQTMTAYAYGHCEDKKKATQASLISYRDQVQRYQQGGYKALKKLYNRLPKAVKRGDK
jgi:hypothetical protein